VFDGSQHGLEVALPKVRGSPQTQSVPGQPECQQCRGEEIGRARARARAIKGWSMPTTEAGCMAPPSPASVVKTSLPVRARELCTRERYKLSSSVRYFVPFNATKCTTFLKVESKELELELKCTSSCSPLQGFENVGPCLRCLSYRNAAHY